jgi:membrane associated rhomboid family serine protease
MVGSAQRQVQPVWLRRVPVLTLVVFVVTGLVNLAQWLHGGLLADLERTPAGQHDQWWRTGTALLVQDGGLPGTVANLACLLILGAAAEQVVGRFRWLLAYLGAAAVGELAGYSWQPVGGGNSVAVCGLAGILVIAMVRRAPALPTYAPFAVMLWAGVLLANVWWPLAIVGAIAAFPVVRASVGGPRARLAAGVLALLFMTAIGVVLVLLDDIHGAAALAGLVLGCVPGPSPVRPEPATAPA